MVLDACITTTPKRLSLPIATRCLPAFTSLANVVHCSMGFARNKDRQENLVPKRDVPRKPLPTYLQRLQVRWATGGGDTIRSEASRHLTKCGHREKLNENRPGGSFPQAQESDPRLSNLVVAS